MFRWSFNGEYGVVYDIDENGNIKENVAWLEHQIVTGSCNYCHDLDGYSVFWNHDLAALQSVPDDIYEAADIDGCGMFRKFFSLTLPYISQLLL